MSREKLRFLEIKISGGHPEELAPRTPIAGLGGHPAKTPGNCWEIAIQPLM
jgi:hypothetical protein